MTGLVAGRPGSAENLLISFDQASEKAAEWALWFEVSFGFFERPIHSMAHKSNKMGPYRC